MLNHLHAIRRRLDERRRYQRLLATLEAINAADVGGPGWLVALSDCERQATGGNPR